MEEKVVPAFARVAQSGYSNEKSPSVVSLATNDALELAISDRLDSDRANLHFPSPV